MKISDALKEVRDLDVHFASEVLHITYRPPSWTPAELEELQADKNIRRIVEQIRKLVVKWDLTDEYQRLVPLELPAVEARHAVVRENGDPVDTDPALDAAPPHDPLMHVPLSIYMKIITAINSDGRPDPQA